MHDHFHISALAKAALIALVSMTALSACQINSRAGKGNLSLSSNTKQGLQTYMGKTFPTIFAASTNGRGYSYYYCETGGCRDTVSVYQGVLDDCQRRSKSTCHVLAISRNIVWKKDTGEAYTLEELSRSGASTSKLPFNVTAVLLGRAALCAKAYDKERRQWSSEKADASFVDEIHSRGITTDFCAKLASNGN